ncbi:MAG: biopolymer transporter ExbD [Alphaproteobacteria bacterium]|nr:biopolymer transporter ExbD [Alphaproteobacteria bacterium]
MGAQLGGKGAMAEINMTPLIDIVLVVLIIMMVNIPIQVEKMGVKLPAQVENQIPPKEPTEQLVIMAYEDGTLALNRAAMPEDQIFGEITRRLRPKEKKIVFVDAHPRLLWERVMDVVDLAREAGAVTVSLARLKAEGPAAPTSAYEGAMPRGALPGTPRVGGEITEKAADEVLQAGLGRFQACFEAALGRRAGLTGRVIVQVDVGPSGEIMGTELVTSTAEDAELEACMVDALQGLSFPALGDQKTARIQYPFLLSPG